MSVGLAAFALFAWTACRTVYFGDSGELIAAARSLGVAHPPGYPLYTLLGRAALALPLGGEPAFSMNLLSGLFGAVCCGAVAWLVRACTGSTAAAAGAALALMAAAPFWAVATVAEVYTLDLALMALGLCCAVALGRAANPAAAARAWLLAGAILGLGLSHRPTLLLALPAALVVYRAARAPAAVRSAHPGAWRAPALAALLALCLPVVLYGSLIPRAAADPALNWGRTVDLERLWAHVTTRAYAHYFVAPEGWFWARAWAGVGRMLLTALGPAGIALAALGLTGVVGRRTLFRPVAAALAVPALLFGLSYATPDVHVLFLPLLLALAVAAGLGIADLASSRFARPWPIGWLAAALVVLPLVVWHHPTHDLRQATAARDYAEDMLASVPRQGVLFVEGDDAFLLAYLTQVLGQRPDLTLYDRAGILFRDEATESGSPPRGGETGPDFRIRREIEFVLREAGRPVPRAVLFMSWPGYELPAGLRFEPEGLFYRVRRQAEPWSDPAPLWEGYRERRIVEQARRLAQPDALTVAATYALMRGERFRFEGDRSSALEAFDRAGALAGNSESIHNYLGTVFGRMGDYPRAAREFGRAIEALPVSVRAWNNLALARSLSGDLEAARSAWRRSLELRPDQADVERSLRLSGG